MLWALAAAGSLGLSLGFWLRPAALIAASAIIAVVCVSVAPFTELEAATAVGMTFALVGVLQLGYLAGLMLSCAWLRIGPSRPGHSSPASDEPDAHLQGAGCIGIRHIRNQGPATALAHANDR
jgi:hypothetical protein